MNSILSLTRERERKSESKGEREKVRKGWSGRDGERAVYIHKSIIVIGLMESIIVLSMPYWGIPIRLSLYIHMVLYILIYIGTTHK